MSKQKPLLLAFVFIFSLNNSFSQDYYGAGIQEVKIELPYKNWEEKLDSMKSANPEARHIGKAWVNGQRFDSVGVRYKGNSSFYRTRKETARKLPFNVKLDFKIKSQNLKEGHGTVKLSNAFLDPGFVREPLAYEVVRTYMPAPRCNFTRVHVNNEYFGIYVNSESIDTRFIQKHFGTETGSIVKCDPDNWKRIRSESGCPKGENASLTYLNDNIGCYDSFYEVDEPEVWKTLLNLIKVLNKNPDEIETVLDVDQTLWMLALNNAMVNLDSYNGSLAHNYYLWFDTSGIAHPLIWDLNMCFGGWRRNFSFEEMKDIELIEYQPLSEITNPKRPLISKLLRVSYYRKIYLAHLRTITDEWLLSGKLKSRAIAMRQELEPYIKKDTLKLYTDADFQNAMDKTLTLGPDHLIGLDQLMSKRAVWLDKHPLLNKPQPKIEAAKQSKEGTKIKITAKLTDATKGAWLYYRKDRMFAFSRIPMLDDGSNGDAAAGDGTFSAQVDASLLNQYYIAAEGEEGARTLPEKASFEYFSVNK